MKNIRLYGAAGCLLLVALVTWWRVTQDRVTGTPRHTQSAAKGGAAGARLTPTLSAEAMIHRPSETMSLDEEILQFLDNPFLFKGREMEFLERAVAAGLREGQLLYTLAAKAWGEAPEKFVLWYRNAEFIGVEERLSIAETILASIDPGAPGPLDALVPHLPRSDRGSALAVGMAVELGKSDPVRASRLALAKLDEAGQSAFAGEFGRHLGETVSLARALGAADTMPNPMRTDFLAGYAATLLESKSTAEKEDFTSWVKGRYDLEPEAYFKPYVQTLGYEAKVHPDQVRDTVERMVDEGRRRDAVSWLGDELMTSDPQGTATWLAASSDPEVYATLESALVPWIQEDPAAAIGWAQALPEGPPRDLAIAAYVEQVAPINATEAKAFVEQIGDAELREDLARAIRTLETTSGG